MSEVSAWLKQAHKNAGWLVTFGIVEIVVGLIALLAPLASGLSVTVILGFALIVGGIVRLFAAFGADSFGSGTLAFIWGLILAGVGFHIFTHPGLGLGALTLALAIMFFLSGLIGIVIAFKMKPMSGWGWTLFGGAVSILLAILVWQQFPFSGAWLVGTLLGVNLIINGITTVTVGTAARKVTA